ncbi:MAG: CpsD/CapB family tyrosine-protein kinase [Eubacteriaceae bacterium]|nr:CpsD/CapB family tyrosine-protein kinase [Eubacteriaceae bacterium]
MVNINWKDLEKFGGESSIAEKERYKVLRTKLLIGHSEKKVFAVTSSLAGEGKTTIALNLARAFKAAGKEVLIMDASLRKHDFKELFIKPAPGLGEFLQDGLPIEDLIVKGELGNPDLLVNYQGTDNSTELLENNKFFELVEKLKESYQIIIIDTPALADCVDSVVIAKASDGVIMVVEENRVRGEQAFADIAFLEETKTPVLGIVLNKIKA